VFWLEITDREVIGEDLQWFVHQADGKRSQSFVMADDECSTGDLVFHLDLLDGAIVGCSQIAGRWKGETVDGEDYWRVPLAKYEDLATPVGLARLSTRKAQIAKVQRMIPPARPKAPSYLPFVIDSAGVKPRENYMAKFPAGIVLLFDELAAAARQRGWRPSEDRLAPGG
jgi:hypothetical protein